MSIKISTKKSISPKVVKNYVLFCDENFKINGLNNLALKNQAKDINKAKFKKLFVYGNYITETFNKIRTQKRGKILKSTSEILNTIKNDLNNGDFLMIKGSNSTGLNQITKQIGLKF